MMAAPSLDRPIGDRNGRFAFACEEAGGRDDPSDRLLHDPGPDGVALDSTRLCVSETASHPSGTALAKVPLFEGVLVLQSHRKTHQALSRGFQQGAFAMGLLSREIFWEKKSAIRASMIIV
jgi:hypothetical protein